MNRNIWSEQLLVHEELLAKDFGGLRLEKYGSQDLDACMPLCDRLAILVT